MDSAADSLLALSNTAAALAAEDDVDQDDDRSSSLSELEDDEADNLESDAVGEGSAVEGDSEAETERLEESPDKRSGTKAFRITPSKLAQSSQADERPEIESLTSESVISSPASSNEDLDNLSDAPAEDEEIEVVRNQNQSPTKRKREDEEEDEEEQGRARRRRTGSIASDGMKSDGESDADDIPSQPSRDASVEPGVEIGVAEDDQEEEEDEPEDEEQKADSNEEAVEKPKPGRGRTSRRRGKQEEPLQGEQEIEDDVVAGEESDDDVEVEVDDAETAAKNEELQAKRMAAMEALTALERHFAALRDRLYDERIAAINQELSQLAEHVPSHPELLRQLEAVRKYRDDKFEVEQKLLVYKIGALKNKSVAERSQIHSAYFQTVRDIRERHLERLSEHFSQIQRDRFRSETAIPSYTIPFPERRSKRITQQMVYNKEVSILAGVAKYVGFPAAPELSQSHPKEMEEDMQKMGVSFNSHVLYRLLTPYSFLHLRFDHPVLLESQARSRLPCQHKQLKNNFSRKMLGQILNTLSIVLVRVPM
jgi:Sds3-like